MILFGFYETPDMWAKLRKVLPSFLICLDGFPAFVSTQALFSQDYGLIPLMQVPMGLPPH
jgi:hypothetical protein